MRLSSVLRLPEESIPYGLEGAEGLGSAVVVAGSEVFFASRTFTRTAASLVKGESGYVLIRS